jgi:hypothetical protein
MFVGVSSCRRECTGLESRESRPRKSRRGERVSEGLGHLCCLQPRLAFLYASLL